MKLESPSPESFVIQVADKLYVAHGIFQYDLDNLATYSRETRETIESLLAILDRRSQECEPIRAASMHLEAVQLADQQVKPTPRNPN